MYWIKTDEGLKKGLGNEVKFQGFATKADLETFAKKNDLELKKLLEEAGTLAWIKQGKAISKGSINSRNFTGFATKAEVEKAGGEIFQAEILNQETKKK